MLELLAYLRANGFKTFIVSGGGVEFMRPWAERVYGIPPEQVDRQHVQGEVRGARRQAGAAPPARDRLHRRQGRQAGGHPADRSAGGRSPRSATPTATSRCSSGRRPAPGPRLGLFVHHTDADREWAYDRTRTSASSPRARRGPEARLARRRHEKRLESDLPVREIAPPRCTVTARAADAGTPSVRRRPAAAGPACHTEHLPATGHRSATACRDGSGPLPGAG